MKLTAKELREVCKGVELLINERNSYFDKGRCRVLNNLIHKLVKEGFNFKNPKDIIYPIYDFEEGKDE